MKYEDQEVVEESALSVGKVAKRWGVSVGRIKQLIEAGRIEGAYTIPSVGRYGKALRIPVESVLRAEEKWLFLPKKKQPQGKPNGRGNSNVPSLRFFPELADQHDSESL